MRIYIIIDTTSPKDVNGLSNRDVNVFTSKSEMHEFLSRQQDLYSEHFLTYTYLTITKEIDINK